jgi:hypothetical protein
MANELIINLDKPRKIKFSMNALIAAAKDVEKETKKPCTVQTLVGKFTALQHNTKPEDVSFEDLRFIAWCGLKHDDPAMSLHECGEIFDLPAVHKFGQAILEMFDNSQIKPDELPKKKPAAKKKKPINQKPKLKKKKSS